jgi:conjugative transfer pilus assembly protein TraH
MKAVMKALLLFLMLVPMTGRSSVDQELDHMFDGMSNSTSPTAQWLQRRGVLSGGSLVLRNRIIQSQPLSLTPPSFAGGCGGIDLYGGSFSFINGRQFTALLRSIAANAGGYAFQLGINAMCPDCGSLMSDLQKKVQTLNQHFANSCQLAQGIVNDGLSAVNAQQQARLSQISLAKGVGDVFETWTQAGGDPVANAQHADPLTFRKKVTGNLVWRALHQTQAGQNQATFDDGLLEAIMSITGTLIIQEPDRTADSTAPSTPIVSLPPILGIREFINGSSSPLEGDDPAQIYQCDQKDPDGCLHPVKVPFGAKGFKARIEALLGGSDGTTGIVMKFSTGQGQFSAEETGFMERAPKAIGALIRNLARADPALARHFVDEASPILAVELAGEMVEGLALAARNASRLEDHPYQPEITQSMALALDDIRRERDLLDRRYGTIEGLVRHYESLMQTGKARDYGVGAMLSGGSRQTHLP